MATLLDLERIDDPLEQKILIAAQKFTDEYPTIKILKDANLMRQSLNELVAKMRADDKIQENLCSEQNKRERCVN